MTDTKLASCEIKAKLPKLPSFCDGKDNMDAWNIFSETTGPIELIFHMQTP